jgi:16S rRNA (cytosine1402-N4)-methyltransferase
MSGHVPVLLNEVVRALAPRAGEVHLDGTFGGGGYARAILSRANITLLAIDRDPTAIARAEELAETGLNVVPLPGCFGEMEALTGAAGFEALDGITLDLGVSSFQIDEAGRGFSFQQDGPLDMRMGGHGPSAADAVAQLSESELADVIYHLGEEREARRIAKFIVLRRREIMFKRTLDLAETVERALGGRRGARVHPATKTFQALRIFVNDELGELARALSACERLLKPGGRLAIVTFHSLEDRMVKAFLRSRAGLEGAGSRHMPEIEDGPAPSFELSPKKAIEPSTSEVSANPRARSARLRVAIRTEAPARDESVPTGLSLPSLDSLEAAA